MFSRFKSLILILSLTLTAALAVVAQQANPSAPVNKPTPQKNEKAKIPKKESKPQTVDLSKNATAEQVAETAIYFYGGGGGRENLKQIRRTTIEDGKLNIINASGANEQVNYERRIMRGDNLEKEKIRLDQEFPNAKYALIYSDNKVVGLYNEAAFTPREDAAKAFQNQIWHGLEALLRYKENGSTLQLIGREKVMGVDLYILEVTDKENRKTKFYISAKTFRVLWLEYAEDGVKYTRRFYDYRYAQGTLVPYRTVLLADNKQIEEANISTSTFGQKIDEEIFKAN
ncbi:MAG: hypothetical protein ACR2N3_11105 [Pyrinomonadaceae bacterium]